MSASLARVLELENRVESLERQLLSLTNAFEKSRAPVGNQLQKDGAAGQAVSAHASPFSANALVPTDGRSPDGFTSACSPLSAPAGDGGVDVVEARIVPKRARGSNVDGEMEVGSGAAGRVLDDVSLYPAKRAEEGRKLFAEGMKMLESANGDSEKVLAVVVVMQKAASKGSLESMMKLADIYYTGKVAKPGMLDRHKKAALLWWTKVIDNDSAHIEALCLKGEAMFQVGDTTPISRLEQAYELFDKAASLGSAMGKFLKGRWLLVMAPHHRDLDRAMKGKKLVDDAARAGIARAYVQLGHCYEYPQSYSPAVFDVPKDRLERDRIIFECYEKAASLGNADGLNDVGSCYATGYGPVEKDFDKAVDYYTRAIAAGSLVAYDNLGTHYETGMSGAAKDRIDMAQALHYYREGASRRCPKCVLDLGISHEEGMSELTVEGKPVLERDTDKAEKYFKHAMALAKDSSDTGTRDRAHKYLAVLYISRLKLSASLAEFLKTERKLLEMMADKVYKATMVDVDRSIVAALRGKPKQLQGMLGELSAGEVIRHVDGLLSDIKGSSAGGGASEDLNGKAAIVKSELCRNEAEESLERMLGKSHRESLLSDLVFTRPNCEKRQKDAAMPVSKSPAKRPKTARFD